MALNFDGSTLPKVSILAGIGTQPAAGSCVLGSGILGTSTLGGVPVVDVAADAQTLSIKRGRDSDIDAATPGSCTIVLDNTSGVYDPTNLASPYQRGSVGKALGLNPDQGTSTINSDLDHLQSVGVDTLWLVLDISWAFPTSTTIDATVAGHYDDCINGAATRGMRLALHVHGNPSWIVTSSGHTYPGNIWHGPDHATERSNWVTCLHNFINRYGATKIDYVEIWNEPNLSSFWVQGVSVADYTRLERDCFVDIKATWPTIKVVGHNISRNDLGWLEEYYVQADTIYTAATAAANSYYFDELGVHPYCGDSTSGYDPADTSHADEAGTAGGDLDPDFTGYQRFRPIILAKEGVNKNIAITEWGYATLGSGFYKVTETQRAGYVPSAVTLAAADGYMSYLNVYYHRNEALTNYANSFNVHATATETAFANVAASGGSTIDLGIPVEVRMEWPLGQVYRRFVGELADISLDLGYQPTATWTFTDGLEKLGRAYLPLEATPVFAGDLTGRRIGNLADRAAWPFQARDLDDGNNALAGTLLGGSALDLMRQVEMTEFGLLFVDGAGVLIFYDRYRITTANRSVLVQANLTDTAAANEVEMVGLEVARSRERVYNRAAVTRQPRAEDPDEQPVEQVADDLASQTTAGPLGEGYGILAFPGQAGELLASDTEALAMAQGLVGRYKDPANRIREVRVDAVTQGEWDVLLPLSLLDRLAVSRDYGPNTIAAQLLIQGSTEEISDQGPSWSFTFATSPAPAAPSDVCVLGSGLLGTHKIAW